MSHALRYSPTALVSRAFCSADVMTSVTDTPSAITIAMMSVTCRYMISFQVMGVGLSYNRVSMALPTP